MRSFRFRFSFTSKLVLVALASTAVLNCSTRKGASKNPPKEPNTPPVTETQPPNPANNTEDNTGNNAGNPDNKPDPENKPKDDVLDCEARWKIYVSQNAVGKFERTKSTAETTILTTGTKTTIVTEATKKVTSNPGVPFVRPSWPRGKDHRTVLRNF